VKKAWKSFFEKLWCKNLWFRLSFRYSSLRAINLAGWKFYLKNEAIKFSSPFSPLCSFQPDKTDQSKPHPLATVCCAWGCHVITIQTRLQPLLYSLLDRIQFLFWRTFRFYRLYCEHGNKKRGNSNMCMTFLQSSSTFIKKAKKGFT